MRIPTALLLAFGVSDAALAHVPDGDAVAAVSHQLLSAHHLPALALAAACVVWGVAVLARRAR